MKIKALLVALVFVGLGACTQRTCPTYANSDIDNQEQKVEATTEAEERV